jgi:hypothetical protein
MKYIIIILFFSMTSLMALPKEKQLVSSEVAINLLQNIKNNAIVLGYGEQEVHTFIDPLCIMSQRYLELLYKRKKKIFAQYTIYLYLHEIKSKNSKQHILNIMHAESSENMLRAIMLNKEGYTLTNKIDYKIKDVFDDVARAANKIGVNKRPFIMINGKVK